LVRGPLPSPINLPWARGRLSFAKKLRSIALIMQITCFVIRDSSITVYYYTARNMALNAEKLFEYVEKNYEIL